MAFLSTHKYRREITIDSSLIDSNLTDFPVMVRLTDGVNIDMNKTKSDGSDVLFTSDDGETILKFEREKHDTGGGEGIYWVKIPTVSSSVDTIFYVYYDSTTVEVDQEDSENVWSSDYKAVYHLHDDFLDSTINNNDLTDHSTTNTTGKIADARQFGTSKWLDAPDSSSLDSLTSQIHLSAWIKASDYNQSLKRIVEKAGTSDSIWLMGIDTNNVYFGLWTGGSQTFFLDAGTLVNGQEHHIICEYNGSNMICYVDGVQVKSIAKTGSIDTSNNPLNIGRRSNPTAIYWGANDYIDEVRVGSLAKGADWAKAQFNSEDDTLVTYGSEEFSGIFINETILINDSTQTLETLVRINEDIFINDTNEQQFPTINISEDIIINEQTISSFTAKFASKIISYNPLLFVTNTSPAKIVEIDVSDPENPTHTVVTLVGASQATDVCLNSVTGFIYVACANGTVVKIDKDNLTNQTIIDLSDADDLLQIECNSNLGLTYVSTENNVGELYIIDERQTVIGDLRLDVLVQKSKKIESNFNTVEAGLIESNIQILSYVKGIINCDFKCITNTVNNIEPIKRTDFDILLDGISLNQSDFDLKSITITHNIDERSTAIFNLCRRHDDPDKDLEGNTRQITNNNAVKITINGDTEFDGFIDQWDAIYNLEQEMITITASADDKSCLFNDITLSLPSLDKPLSLYDILDENVVVYNPTLDPDDNDSVRFKGIRIPLGTRVTQSYSRFTTIDSLNFIAESIQNNTFVPKQNWTYFWSPTVTKFGDFTLGDVRRIKFNYIGTSLAPVSEGLWNLDQADHRRQRRYDDLTWKLGDGSVQASDFVEVVDDTASLITELQTKGWIDGGGNITSNFKKTVDSEELELSVSQSKQIEIYEILENSLGYTIGEAPFRNISSRNGILITKFHWEDESDGLYSIKDESYNFEEYVKKIAELEYEKLKNINGNVLPETKATLDITVDCYKYYNFNMLTRIKVDNTTQNSVFTTENGFPTAVKSIIINSNSMRVTLVTDNLKSNKELEAIDGEFPDENDEEYNEKEKRILIDPKSDMRTRLEVE